MVTFRPNRACERAARVQARLQPLQNILEVASRTPAQFVPGTLVAVNPVDTWKHSPATARVLVLVLRNSPLQRQRSVAAQIGQVVAGKRSGRTHDIAAEANGGC